MRRSDDELLKWPESKYHLLTQDELLRLVVILRSRPARAARKRAGKAWRALIASDFDRVRNIVVTFRFPDEPGVTVRRDNIDDAVQYAFERLTKMQKTPAECRNDVLEATRRLTEQAKLRNKYNHCIYSFDPDSGQGLTQLMRIFDSKDEVKYGKVEALDDQEVVRIKECIASLVAINRMLWEITDRYGFPR